MHSALPPGANIPLTQENPGLNEVFITIQYGPKFNRVLAEDVQAGVVLCDERGKAAGEEQLVYSHQVASVSGAVEFKENDAYIFSVALQEVPEEVQKIELVLWSDSNKSTLAALDGVTAVLHSEAGRLVRVQGLSNDSTCRAAVLLSLYRHRGEWKVRARGEGWPGGLPSMLKAYGVVTK